MGMGRTFSLSRWRILNLGVAQIDDRNTLLTLQFGNGNFNRKRICSSDDAACNKMCGVNAIAVPHECEVGEVQLRGQVRSLDPFANSDLLP